MNRLQEKYTNEVVAAMQAKFNYSSVMETPKVTKIVINIGAGDAVQNPKVLDDAVSELAQITGQKPVITKAKKINCELQTTGRYAYWLQSNPSRSTDV